jgi:hypothetical protein
MSIWEHDIPSHLYIGKGEGSGLSNSTCITAGRQFLKFLRNANLPPFLASCNGMTLSLRCQHTNRTKQRQPVTEARTKLRVSLPLASKHTCVQRASGITKSPRPADTAHRLMAAMSLNSAIIYRQATTGKTMSTHFIFSALPTSTCY